MDQMLLNQVRLPRYQQRTNLFCQKGETLVVEDIEDQDFLVKELEDIGHLVSKSYIEEQIGREDKN